MPAFLKDNKIPAGNLVLTSFVDTLNKRLKETFGVSDLVIDILNQQVFLNIPLIDSNTKLNPVIIKKWIVNYLINLEAVDNAFVIEDLQNTTLNSFQKKTITNGFYPNRCGQIYMLLKPQWLDGFEKGGTTHGLWNPYDAHIPLIWYGWKIKQGVTYRNVSMTDIAPTLAALLKFQVPNGSVGEVITELLK